MLLRQIAVCLAELVRTAEVTDRAELNRSMRCSMRGARKRRPCASASRGGAVARRLRGARQRAAGLVPGGGGPLQGARRIGDRDAAPPARQPGAGVRRAGRRARCGRRCRSGRGRRSWRCDVLPLRERAGSGVSGRVRAGRVRSRPRRAVPLPAAQADRRVAAARLRGNLLEVPAWPRGAHAVGHPLGDKVTMDLGMSWWRRWFAGRRAAEERASHLRYLIEEDFLRIADELVRGGGSAPGRARRLHHAQGQRHQQRPAHRHRAAQRQPRKGAGAARRCGRRGTAWSASRRSRSSAPTPASRRQEAYAARSGGAGLGARRRWTPRRARGQVNERDLRHSSTAERRRAPARGGPRRAAAASPAPRQRPRASS